MMQSCLWRHYHEKAPPSQCTYLTSDLPFVPPRQQIAAVVAAVSLAARLPLPSSRRGRVVGGCLSIRSFNSKVNSHTPPPSSPKNTHRHTRSHTLNQTGWRTPSQQPFFATLLLSAPPFHVWVLMKRGGPMEGTWLGGTLRPRGRRLCMIVCVCVSGFWRLNPIELEWDEKHMQHITGASHSQQHQWCPLFYHQSLGTSLCTLCCYHMVIAATAFNTKAVLITTMLFSHFRCLQICDCFRCKM